MLQEAGEDLHHPGVKPLFIGGEELPLRGVRIEGQLGVGRNDAISFCRCNMVSRACSQPIALNWYGL